MEALYPSGYPGTETDFRSHLIDWQSYNRAARLPIDPKELERGDHLLTFGKGNEKGTESDGDGDGEVMGRTARFGSY